MSSKVAAVPLDLNDTSALSGKAAADMYSSTAYVADAEVTSGDKAIDTLDVTTLTRRDQNGCVLPKYHPLMGPHETD